ncbi:putative DMT superfamily transporter inner membrane protein [Escherichia coli]|uniref:Putative DMT superfamily transporter inner membrane protein n=1 Tax=Escherichia coli TaxID=562 RepID=A0A2X3KEX2_ECOLX|nr:putative DMT superfamily transporter inner membrane protein [Escherichia coli]
MYTHLGAQPIIVHSDWRGKLASVNDGRRSIPGSRYFIDGIFATALDTSSPRYVRCSNAALIGLLLLAVGNGMVTVAEHQNVPSGIAAVVVATVPLFTLCFSRLFGIKTRKLEWVGIAIGLAGIIMLQ